MAVLDDLFKKYKEILSPVQNTLSGMGSNVQNAVKNAAVGQVSKIAPQVNSQNLQNVYKSYLKATPYIPLTPTIPTQEGVERIQNLVPNAIQNVKNYSNSIDRSSVYKKNIYGQKVPTKPGIDKFAMDSFNSFNVGATTSNKASYVDDVLKKGYQEIGSLKAKPGKSLAQNWDDFYTNWIDRFNPIVKTAEAVEKVGKKQGFELRPENNPIYTIRRFLGAQGVADQRFQSELKPIINEAQNLKIDPKDLDLYLKSRRDVNLAQRGIQGSDAKVATERLQALGQKYGQTLDGIASKLYEYQDKGLEELAQAGFLSQDKIAAIRNANKDYVPFQRVFDEIDEFLGMPSKTAQQSANPLQKIKGSDKQIYSPVESIVANTFKQRAAIEKNRVANSIVDLVQSMPELGFKPVAKAGNNAITVWKNGQKQYWEVGEDIASAVKGLDEESMNSFLKVLSIPASMLRQGATGRNVEFMIPNMLRDQFDAAANSKYGYIPFVDYAKGLYHLIRKDEVYQRWLKSGGSQSFGSLSGRSGIQEAVSGATGKRNLFQWLGAGLDVVGKYSEQPTRLGLFNNALKKTGNDMLAGFESREGTLDFARMGAKMKVANSIIPFLNVGIQGFDRMVRAAKANPARFGLNMTLYGVTPSVVTTLYNIRYFPDEYAEIPQYVKDDNFVIVKGRNEAGTVDYITLPKGNVISYVANPVENFLSYASKTTPATIDEMALQFLSSATPVIGDGSSIKEIALKTVGSNLPQAIKPITENLINKSFYKYNPDKEESKEIVPTYLKKKPAYEQAYDWTPEMYKTFSRVASGVAGINVSPLMIQNLMEGYFAGHTKMPAQIWDIVKAAGEGKPLNNNQVPILRRFIQTTIPSPAQQEKLDQLKSYRASMVPLEDMDRASLVEGASASEKQSTSKPKPKKVTSVSLAKEKAKETGVPQESNGTVYYTENGKNKTIPVDRPVRDLKLTGSDTLDKRELSQVKSSLETKISDTKKLYDLGLLGREEAESRIKSLEEAKASISKTAVKKGSGKGRAKKITIPKMKAITLKIPKAKAVKTVKIKPIRAKARRIRPVKLGGKRITKI